MKNVGSISENNSIGNDELADILTQGIETSLPRRVSSSVFVPAGIEVPSAPLYEMNKKSYATNFLQRYYYNIKPIFEIVTYSDNQPDYSSGFTFEEYINNQNVENPTQIDGFEFVPSEPTDDANTTRRFKVDYTIRTGADEQFIFNRRLMAASKSDDKPLVMLITAIGMEHAMIFIIHDGILYTAGFGYYGSISEPHSIFDIHGRIQSRISPAKVAAVYSADYLQPLSSHKSQIVWIGLLDQCMATNLNNDISQVKRFTYNGIMQIESPQTNTDDLDTTTYYMIPMQLWEGRPEEEVLCRFQINSHAILTLPEHKYQYREISLPKFTEDNEKLRTNCIGWAMKALNIKLNCGFPSIPSECTSVPSELVSKIFTYWPTGSDERKIKNLDAILDPLQKELGQVNACTNAQKTLGHAKMAVSKKLEAMSRKIIAKRPRKGGRKTHKHKRASKHKHKRASKHKHKRTRKLG
jgi:hypothetical protein